jgi:hypothetical protein
MFNPGLSRVRTSTAASTRRPDASDDPTDVRLADGKAVGHLSAAATDGRRGPTALRLPKGVAGRRGRPPRPSDGGGRLPRPQLPSTGSRPPPPSIWGRPSRAVRLCRPLSMTPISPFYTMCLLL